MQIRDFFYDLNQEEAKALTEELSLPSYRAGQILQWQKRGIIDFSEMTDLSVEVRKDLAGKFIQTSLKPIRELCSKTGDSIKYLYELHDRQRIETVLMRYRYGNSVCISSEAGCLMGCAFCASTVCDYGRGLTSGEMFAQVAQTARLSDSHVRNVTVMGTGEPLNNLEELIVFLKRLHDPDLGFGMSYCNMTVSTCGIIDKMLVLAAEVLPITLSISLHAPNQVLREELMPIARLYHFKDLLDAARKWTAITGRRVTFEYAMFKDLNDSIEQAGELADQLLNCNCHVNLIPANRVPGLNFEPSAKETISAFQNELGRRGINVTVRRSLGQDVNAACGQLRRQLPEDDSANT